MFSCTDNERSTRRSPSISLPHHQPGTWSCIVCSRDLRGLHCGKYFFPLNVDALEFRSPHRVPISR